MGSSIQDYLKKINSRISLFDLVSLSVTLLFLCGFCVFLLVKQSSSQTPVTYVTQAFSEAKDISSQESNNLPFGSKHGKTYTFSWCQGARRILEKNKVYFAGEAEAKNSGRTLSKTCSK
jgi:hypothetical protein